MRTRGFDLLRQRRYLLLTFVAILVLLGGLIGVLLRTLPGASVPAPRVHAPTTSRPTAPTSTPQGSGIPGYDHVVIIMMENHAYQDIIGDAPDAPYINTTLVPMGALASMYFAVAHPSLPNYLALTSGATWDIGDDGSPAAHPLSVANVAGEVEAAGKTWKAYEESMPANCDRTDAPPYYVKHNPFAYYMNLPSCATQDVPYSQLATDLGGVSTLPSYVFITPNVNDDMHDGTIAQGDTWLANNVPQILNSPAFTQQHSLLVITWDEDDGAHSNRVATIFVGYAVAVGHRSTVRYGHYALLKTVEAGLRLATMTRNDGDADAMMDLLTPTA
ncbi:MAG TPA: alkaline phosphatase family protein [Ktedonobacterales bacterium]|nr:alkaline phosphatase family protein [Ktedonobacterales bacterium]